MNISIRKATPEDFPVILSLIKELATYEKSTKKVTNTVGQMRQEQDLFRCKQDIRSGKRRKLQMSKMAGPELE